LVVFESFLPSGSNLFWLELLLICWSSCRVGGVHILSLSIIQRCWMWHFQIASMLEIECQYLFVTCCCSCWIITQFLFLILAKTFPKSTELCGLWCTIFFAEVPTLHQ
jgi:hypothetical protein